MALEDYRSDMEMCCRCSICKFIPMEKVQGFQQVNICPSIARYNFHAYSGGGRMGFGVAMLENRLEYTDKLLEVVYNCQMCGGCDISCKYAMDMEVLEPMNEFRIKCVEDGHTILALDGVINSLRKQGTMVPGAKAKRGEWAGVSQVNPDFAMWTANERLKEVKATGATALVTSCPWCERNFKDAIKEYREEIEVYDIAEIAFRAI